MRTILILFFLLSNTVIFSQYNSENSLVSELTRAGFIEGLVLDVENFNEPFGFAEVQVKNTTFSETTDLEGAFKFKLNPGIYTIFIRFLGYKTIEIKNIKVSSAEKINIKEFLSALKLDENEISFHSLEEND